MSIKNSCYGGKEMKNLLSLLLLSILIFTLSGCSSEVDEKSLAGTFVGYSWKGESNGVDLADASQKIETILTLDENGVILDASMLFWKLSDGSWYSRQDGTARISVDLNINPIAATPGNDYIKGTSMFDVDTHDMMSLYAVAVGADGTIGLLIVEPVTRYQFELKLEPGFNYSTLISDISTDGTSLGFIPTIRTSSSGLVKPDAWTELTDKNLFSISYFDHVMSDTGVFEGITSTSTIKEFLTAAGVMFTLDSPDEMSVVYGRHSLGGWQGNYNAITNYLIGKNVNDVISLIDWSTERWEGGVNDENFFGIDLEAGATKTAQNSLDGIAGATVRMSRESTSFQRALVAAGILTEDDVIKGRF